MIIIPIKQKSDNTGFEINDQFITLDTCLLLKKIANNKRMLPDDIVFHIYVGNNNYPNIILKPDKVVLREAQGKLDLMLDLPSFAINPTNATQSVLSFNEPTWEDHFDGEVFDPDGSSPNVLFSTIGVINIHELTIFIGVTIDKQIEDNSVINNLPTIISNQVRLS